jgi:hypothetical protein
LLVRPIPSDVGATDDVVVNISKLTGYTVIVSKKDCCEKV